ncbi:inner membrane protein YhjD [Mycolicibacterium psychrotolerans]|uniref:Inner membrane protein YhjD n=1 Tax=Mycolicibacterium psychrotolerans TaxID=216929 RepID=A0A7I7MHT4_9MYCO|nr:inner membrane protein YhjD [Mycolicibacterium psychrotolerans]BBX71715.1 inner membrane protein YhjD [Mycolicibacterium psychrotolerans]
MTAPESSPPEEKPGVLDRLRARMPWFDHVMRAQQRYNDSKGDFYAAGITYFTIFALFPLLMVGFSIGGFVLAGQPELLDDLETRVRSSVSGELGQQLVQLMDSAIASRTSVGVIGLLTAAWAGLGWMANLREALSQMWGLFRDETPGFLKTKLSDLVALLSAFVAIAVTVALSALSNKSVMKNLFELIGLEETKLLSVLFRVASILVSVLVSWMFFTLVIARLPRESVGFRSSMRAGLLAAVAFEVFKMVGAVYLRSVVNGPAGATFGPVLGLMVFAYITARLILFSTAWAATASENMVEAPIPAPGPAVIRNRIITRPGLAPWQAGVAAAAGALGALSFSRRRDR